MDAYVRCGIYFLTPPSFLVEFSLEKPASVSPFEITLSKKSDEVYVEERLVHNWCNIDQIPTIEGTNALSAQNSHWKIKFVKVKLVFIVHHPF